MAIGVHDCQPARDVDLKGAIQIGLDEALTALAESFADLTRRAGTAVPDARAEQHRLDGDALS